MGTHSPEISNYFNRTGRTQRLLVSEETYSKGLQYTENVLPEGSSKLLINFKLNEVNGTLTPRNGIINYSEAIDTEISASDDNTLDKAAMHYASYGIYTNIDSIANYTDICYSFGRKSSDSYKAEDYMYAMVQDSTTKGWRIAKYEGNKDYRIKLRSITNTIHDFDECTMYEPICCTYNGRCFCMSKEGSSGKYMMTRLDIKEVYIDEQDHDAGTKLVIEITQLEPYDLIPTEAGETGYNMLADNPYYFENKEGAVTRALGINMYKTGTNTCITSADLGDTVDLVLFYGYETGKNYEVKWEWTQDFYSYTTIQDFTSITPGAEARISYTPSSKTTAVRATIRIQNQATDQQSSEKNVILGYTDIADLGTNNYDLTTCKYMLEHKGSIFLWGVKGAENTLFASYVNKPHYFPFTQNTHTFNEKIVAVEPYLQNLIIITTKKVYLLSLSDTSEQGNILTGATVTTLHETLGIQDIDSPTVKAISNMVFFRTNNKFYVICPVAKSGVYTLKVLECHAGVQDFVDKFSEKMKTIMFNIWNVQPEYVKLIKSFTYINATDARVVYTLELNEELLVNVILSYNVNTYVWMMEIHQANYSMLPYKASDIRPILYYTSYKEGETYKARVVGYDELYMKDNFSLSELNPRVMLNYQYLDTGSRDQDKFHKKRYRELDLNFNNRSGKSLTFALDFRLDGQPRQNTVSYSIEHDTDPTSPTYGLLSYERHNTDNIGIGGKTTLDVWELDSSGFPELDKAKVRFKISGKGYYCQYVLISKNEEDFELLNHVWICRPMFAR